MSAEGTYPLAALSVRYSIRSEPLISGNCQCRTCRSASAAAIVPRLTISSEHFVFSAGRPTEYSSSPQATRTFWGRCGTPLTYWHTSYEGKKIDVTTVSLDDPEAFPPQGHIWRVTNTLSQRDKLVANDNGSADIYPQADSPGKDKEANRLPAPKAKFTVMLRMYWPKDRPVSILDGTWKPPPTRRLDS